LQVAGELESAGSGRVVLAATLVRREVNKNGEGSRSASVHVRRSAPLVPVDGPRAPNFANALDGALDTLLKSLKGIAPDRIQWVVALMKMVFPQSEVIVNGNLQRWEDVPSRLGITLSVSDIDDRQNRSYLTI